MPRDLDPPVPPGEEPLDLPATVGWLVAVCTSVRQAVLAAGEPARRARGPARICET